MITIEPDKIIIIYENNYVRECIEHIAPDSIFKFIKVNNIADSQYIASSCNIYAILSERNTISSLCYIFKIRMVYHHAGVHFISLNKQSDVVKRTVEYIGGTYDEIGFKIIEFQNAILRYISRTDINHYDTSTTITPLEAKIIVLYLNNISRKRIALNLGRDPKTIHSHILNSLKK
ncbi:hypothetical protein [Citrobacter sp. Cb004]|uniref:helix-turn-helix transcriptional regulator n=1 Tax=Citrobacter sp. Cb004 TaxID=2985006 RepID=UPI0025757744|nr:hypothetical protein [Citrobacter sp. Cb004]MDM3359266.1 hypothetical protein [Citrobacter sp. Cb004]